MSSASPITVKIFAYGSNLCIERMRVRVPSARPLTVAALGGHELRFHKIGRDDSAKADAYCTGEPGHAVWGVVYELGGDDKKALDGFERGYHERNVTLDERGGGIVQAQVYLADADRIDPSLKPFSWYVALVAAGARQHGLPPEYLAAIEAVGTVEDPDHERHAREMSVIQ